ncbi:hypothetical protein PCURB6_31550 [Paenibacillus curdlanolyticus]|nr:hypothetical protein PCURB6_31550 [Paenibacillus curdlanolyticus]
MSIPDGQPFVTQGTTFVPMRSLFKLLDIQITWNSQQQTVSGSRGNLSFSLQIGSTKAEVNGRAVQLSAAPRIIHNVTYVPLRFVSEATGYKVGWTAASNTITLTSPPQKAASKGFLWRVQHDGNTVYLLGSIHAASDSMYPLRPEIEQALNSADYLGVEADITSPNQESLSSFIKTNGMYNDGTTLKDHISAATYRKLTTALALQGLDPNSMDNYKPWYVDLVLQTLKLQQSDYETALGIDAYLLQKAKENGKTIIELESVELQWGVYSGFSDSLQEALLNGAINSFSQDIDNNAGIDELSKMWTTGDEQLLVQYTNAIAATPEYYEGFIAKRNDGMTEKIKGYLMSADKKTYLIVVGALHMLGPDGIVTQLENAGYTVDKL